MMEKKIVLPGMPSGNNNSMTFSVSISISKTPKSNQQKNLFYRFICTSIYTGFQQEIWSFFMKCEGKKSISAYEIHWINKSSTAASIIFVYTATSCQQIFSTSMCKIKMVGLLSRSPWSNFPSTVIYCKLILSYMLCTQGSIWQIADTLMHLLSGLYEKCTQQIAISWSDLMAKINDWRCQLSHSFLRAQ